MGYAGNVQQPKGIRLVDKAVEVIDRLVDEGELTVAQLAELTGEPRSSLYRLLYSLESSGLVEPSAKRGQYRLGLRLLRWGEATRKGLNIREISLPVLQDIHDQTGLTTYLIIRRGDLAVCIERIEGIVVSRLALVLGGTLPLHMGAGPRALLAWEPEEEWQEYIARASQSEQINAEKLISELEESRDTFLTLSDGDVTKGIASMGVPIFGHHNRVIGAISISGLRVDVVEHPQVDLQKLLLDSAAKISRDLGSIGIYA